MYQDVILPLTVLRRIDQVLEPTKEKVLKTYSEFKGKRDNPDDLLRKASGYAFYNTSRYTFERLVDDPQNIAHNLRTYIQSFSPNMREVIEKFDFDNTVTKLDDAGLLFQVMEKFAQVDLHPDRVSNPMMGTIFEELIRKFNEALNENPGEHFTPRDVVHLMVRLLVEGEEGKLGRERAYRHRPRPVLRDGRHAEPPYGQDWKRNRDAVKALSTGQAADQQGLACCSKHDVPTFPEMD